MTMHPQDLSGPFHVKLIHPLRAGQPDARSVPAFDRTRRDVNASRTSSSASMIPMRFMVNFEYTHGQTHKVTTLRKTSIQSCTTRVPKQTRLAPNPRQVHFTNGANSTVDVAPRKQNPRPELKEQHLELASKVDGFTFDRHILARYMSHPHDVVDPYIRQPYQARNLMELIETIAKYTDTTKGNHRPLRPPNAIKKLGLCTKQQEANQASIRTVFSRRRHQVWYSFNDYSSV